MENKDRMLGEGIARQELHLMFIIDNSGSMEGEKLGAVNNAIRDVMSIMPEIQEDTADATIKIYDKDFKETDDFTIDANGKLVFSNGVKVDTLSIEHLNTDNFISLECGCFVYHTIQRAYSCGTWIDSVAIITTEITSINAEEHLQVFFN